jgi:hypothetical protein
VIDDQTPGTYSYTEVIRPDTPQYREYLLALRNTAREHFTATLEHWEHEELPTTITTLK